jgi:hypothetical protein
VNKREVIWLLIRLAGLWLLWQAGEDAITLMSSYLTAIEQTNLLVQIHLGVGGDVLSEWGFTWP